MDLILYMPFFTLLIVGIVILFSSVKLEGYTNYNLEQSMSNVYPESQTTVLVQDTYPAIGKNNISNDTSNDLWKKYPVFSLGSYDQITNNIRYPDNPDEGTCMPASMCGALYHDKHTGSNVIQPLEPVDNTLGTRVGYFNTNNRIVTSLPYRSELANILY